MIDDEFDASGFKECEGQTKVNYVTEFGRPGLEGFSIHSLTYLMYVWVFA